MMKNLQKMGGIAALYAGAAYVVGMVGFLTVVDVSSVADPVKQVALMADNLAFLYIMHLIVYVVWGVFMVVLSLALYERLKAGSPAIVQTATVFGIFWACVIITSGMIHNIGMENVVDLYGKDPAQAATVWLAIDSVLGGLAGSNEVLGGIWILSVWRASSRLSRLSPSYLFTFLRWVRSCGSYGWGSSCCAVAQARRRKDRTRACRATEQQPI